MPVVVPPAVMVTVVVVPVLAIVVLPAGVPVGDVALTSAAVLVPSAAAALATGARLKLTAAMIAKVKAHFFQALIFIFLLLPRT